MILTNLILAGKIVALVLFTTLVVFIVIIYIILNRKPENHENYKATDFPYKARNPDNKKHRNKIKKSNEQS
jgi:uncharacterized protein YggT (Ycf19 family)